MEKYSRNTALALLIFFLSLAALHYGSFSLEKIKGPLLEGSAPAFPPETLALFEQPYFYLSKGRQCFVFVSADGKAVLKFFNYDRFRFPSSLAKLTPRLKAYAQKRSARFQTTLTSLQIANTLLKEETGLIALHLHESKDLPTLTFFDSLDRCHTIDLNRVAFILQKRATSLIDVIEDRGAKEVIDSYCLFLKNRCEKKISDDDRDVMRNFGFLGDRLINLDPGRLFFSQRLETREGLEKEVRIATKRLKKYLLKNHPELIPYLEFSLTELVDSLNQSDAASATSSRVPGSSNR